MSDRAINNCSDDFYSVMPINDEDMNPWQVAKYAQYPRYSNDHWARVNSYNWRHHPNSVYAPLNENAQKSQEYRKYVPDQSGLPVNWYRHVIEPTYEWMFEQDSQAGIRSQK